MNMKSMLLIINPMSGKGEIGDYLLGIIDIFIKHDIWPTVYITQKKGDATEKARENAGKYDIIACCGGDGTLDEVVTGVVKSHQQCRIGYIPMGSTNDYAQSLRLAGDIQKAALAITKDSPISLDVGRFDDDVFVYVAAFGMFTEVSYRTPQDMKNALGHMAYIIEGAKSLFEVKTYPMKVIADGETIEGEFLYGMVANSESVGGFKNLTGDNIQLNDGLFEVVLIRQPETPLGWNEVINGLLTHQSSGDIFFLKAHRITFLSDTEVPWTLDGEDGGLHREVLIRNRRNAIQILVDEPEEIPADTQDMQ